MGDLIWPKWVALQSFVRTTGVVRGKGVKIRVTPNGTHVWVDGKAKSWPHPFRVSVSTGSATVSPGTVNNTAPTIDEVRISGYDDDGNRVEVPPLPVQGVKKGKTFIGILLTPVGGELDPVTPSNLRIAEKSDLRDILDGQAFYPLAVVYWKDSAPVSTFQVSHHNLNHIFVPGDVPGGRPDRHVFSAA